MKLLKALMKEAAGSEMDPSTVTARDVSTYVSQVKRALKGKQITKGSVRSAVHSIAEDDPKFGANPKALPKLVTAVCAKLCESIEAELVSEDVSADDIRALFENEDEGFVLEEAVRAYDVSEVPQRGGATVTRPTTQAGRDDLAAAVKRQREKARVADVSRTSRSGMQSGNSNYYVDKKFDGYRDGQKGTLVRNEDEEDSQPAKFSANSSTSELNAQVNYLKGQMESNKGNRVMHIKLKQALTKIEGFLKQKQVKESVELPLAEDARIDVDELSVSEIQSKLLAAAKAGHPGVTGMKVHADDKMMRVEVPGKDRCYATVSLTTGVITVLKEGWDSEQEEEEEVADKPAKKMSPRAEAAKCAKDKKEVKEDVETNVNADEVASKTVGRFMQAILASKQTTE